MPAVLAAHTYSFREVPLEEALDRLVALGFEHIELWLGHVDAAATAARALEERGLAAVAVGGGGFYSAADDPRRLIEIAEQVRAPVVVACASPAQLERVAAFVGTRATLCVENHWDQELSRPGAVRSALAAVPTAAACLDTGHALLAGVRPDLFARRLGPVLRHVHLKESRLPTVAERLIGRRARRRLLARPQPLFPGRGALDAARLRRELERASFDGAVTVEHEGPDAAEALAELRRRWSAAASP